MKEAIKVLDHGYVRFIEAWGHGDAGEDAKGDYRIDLDEVVYTHDYECGIIEAARQSTQGSFRGWEDKRCDLCGGTGKVRPQGWGDGRGGVDLNAWAICNDGRPGPAGCEGKGYFPGDERLLRFLFTGKPQHATPFEFSGMTIEVQAPIMVYREWHRHRVQSFEEAGLSALDSLDTTAFNEMSGRYAPIPDVNYVPTTERLLQVNQQTKNKQAGAVKGADTLTPEMAQQFATELETMYRAQETFYQRALKFGVAKELARLPIGAGRYSRMRASTNLRNWLAFLTLRADPAAAWEIQQFAHAVGTLIEHYFPRTWNLYKLGRG